jgi:hypothetical protein
MIDESVASVRLQKLETGSAPVTPRLGELVELISATLLEPLIWQDYLPSVDPPNEANIHWLILPHVAGFSAPSWAHLGSMSQKEQGTSIMESMLEYLRLAKTR